MHSSSCDGSHLLSISFVVMHIEMCSRIPKRAEHEHTQFPHPHNLLVFWRQRKVTFVVEASAGASTSILFYMMIFDVLQPQRKYFMHRASFILSILYASSWCCDGWWLIIIMRFVICSRRLQIKFVCAQYVLIKSFF